MISVDSGTLTASLERNLKLFLGKAWRDATVDDAYLQVAFKMSQISPRPV